MARLPKSNPVLDRATDAGAAYFKIHPQELLAAVYRQASADYPDDKEAQLTFGEAFKRARALRDEFMMESD